MEAVVAIGRELRVVRENDLRQLAAGTPDGGAPGALVRSRSLVVASGMACIGAVGSPFAASPGPSCSISSSRR